MSARSSSSSDHRAHHQVQKHNVGVDSDNASQLEGRMEWNVTVDDDRIGPMQDAGISFLAGVLVLNATFSSSAPSGIADTLVEEFALSEEEVVTLTISLFVAGYCIGQCSGMALPYWYSAFWAGYLLVFAASPLTNSGSLSSKHSMPSSQFVGPDLGPTVAGFINVSGTSWRWLFEI
ncbi:hypothetical protein EV368DRAFT_63560 [Lentinula lateritia]|nr:hypothetical protein EV368DRAFT_63560 [Lentinula lateritia]